MSDWDNDILSEDETDDGIIELMDIVDEVPEGAAEENIIELTDVVENDNSDLNLEIEASDDDFSLDIDEQESTDLNLDIIREESDEDQQDFNEIRDEETILDSEKRDTVDQSLELNMNDEITEDLVESSEEISSLEDVAVSGDQLAAALERVIEKKFGDKIETILFEVLEKVVEREIVEIKESLQQDLDHIGNV